MIIPVKKTLNNAGHIDPKLIDFSEICQKKPAKSAVFYWLFLGEVSPWNFPWNWPIFLRTCSWKSFQIWLKYQNKIKYQKPWLIKKKFHFDFLVVFTRIKALSTPLPFILIIALLEPAFLFFVLTSGRALPVKITCLFEATLQPLCSADHDSGIFCTAATALFIAVKGLSLQRETAIFCYCCSQPFCSSFVALLEAILQRCSSAARFVRVGPIAFLPSCSCGANLIDWIKFDFFVTGR